MNRVSFTLILIVLLAVIVGLGYTLYSGKTQTTHTTPPVTDSTNSKAMSIENYVTLSISDLSPIKAVLGGTYYVTDVTADEDSGTVKYEDGHNAYTADFTYTRGEHDAITVTSFVIRK